MLSFRNLFKKKRTNIRNCHHSDFAHLVEPAFIGHGVHSDRTQYYRFKGNSELDMIAGRYNTAIKFFYEMNMRMSGEDLKFYLDKIEGVINSSEVRLSEIAKWVSVIKDRTQLLVDNKTTMKLASASYFDENEVLDSYDFEYNLKKIKAWEEGGDYSFFFMKPMSDLLPLPDTWREDFGQMRNYMALAETIRESHLSTQKS